MRITLKAATKTLCAELGAGSDRLEGNQANLLKRIAERHKGFEELMMRAVAAARGDNENPASQGNVVNALNAWSSQIENDIESAFGAIGGLDLRNTKPSDELLNGDLAEVNFDDSAKAQIRRATAYKSCLQAIEGNLKARPQ